MELQARDATGHLCPEGREEKVCGLPIPAFPILSLTNFFRAKEKFATSLSPGSSRSPGYPDP